VYPTAGTAPTTRAVVVTTPTGVSAEFVVKRTAEDISATSTVEEGWRMHIVRGASVTVQQGEARITL
jgi:hypothetical protein